MSELIAENLNEMEQNLNSQELNGTELVTAEEQNGFLDSTLGKVINTAVDLGLRWILPDFIENQIIEVKDTLITGGLKEGIDKAIDSAIDLGKSITGIFTGKFEDVSQAQNAIKKGVNIDKPDEKKDLKTNKINKNSKSSKSTKSVNKKEKSSKKTTPSKVSKSSSAKKMSASTKKKTSTNNVEIINDEKIPNIVEYYDLPYRYNQTVVKVLAQTPTNLFIYWDISDEDREQYVKEYGENFFETTKPVLIVYNDTLNYHFEVEINDFANSWYLHVNDSKCDYHVELGRRPFVFNANIKKDYIPITVSNKIESPNDRVLLNLQSKTVCFRNLKTNEEIKRPITTFSFIEHKGSFTSIYDLYKKMYPKENIDEYFEVVKSTRLRNPSSSTFSSQFK